MFGNFPLIPIATGTTDRQHLTPFCFLSNDVFREAPRGSAPKMACEMIGHYLQYRSPNIYAEIIE